MRDQLEIAVVGGGIAGLTAGLVAARLGRRTRVLAGDIIGGLLLSIDRIDGVPGFPEGVPGYDLCPMAQEQAIAAGAEVVTARLERLARSEDGWRLATSAGEMTVPAVILATGAKLKRLGLPAETRLLGKGVSQCASCDGPLLRNRGVAVVGGGDSALQEALTLAEIGAHVFVLHRGNALSGQAAYRGRASRHPRIEVRSNTVVEDILGDERVTAVRTREVTGSEAGVLDVAAVFVYIGLEPSTDLLEGRLALDPAGRIPTDARMRTELPGVLAAGAVRSGSSGRAIGAAGDGASAAIAADAYLADGAW